MFTEYYKLDRISNIERPMPYCFKGLCIITIFRTQFTLAFSFINICIRRQHQSSIYWSFVRGITMRHYCWVPLKRPVMGRVSIIARFRGPAWGPSGAARIQSCPMLAPWTLLSGVSMSRWEHEKMKNELSSETNSEGIFETHQPSLVMHNSLNFTLGRNFIESNGNMSYM